MVKMEQRGKPAAAIVSGGFEEDAAITGRVLGLPDLKFITVPDVLTGLPDELICSQIEDALEEANEILTSPPGAPRVRTGDKLTGREPAASETFSGEDVMVAWEAMNNEWLSRGWADGFPLIAPTPERVAAALRGTTLAPDHVVGILPPGYGIAIVEKIAINCVMAGCEPAHLPVMIAAVKAVVAVAGPGYDMSTSADAPLLIVNGPIVKELGINSERAALGPGVQSRVNIVLGRAMRLIKMNIGFNRPGVMDMDTIGAPTKFSMCIGENEEKSPWDPWHVEHGFDEDKSTVAVLNIRNQKELADMFNTTPEGVLDTFAFGLSVTPEHYGYYGRHQCSYLLMISPEHASILERYGWDKESVRRYVWHRSEIPAARHTNQIELMHKDVQGKHWQWYLNMPQEQKERLMLPVVETPDRYKIVVVGGVTGKSLSYSFMGAYSTTEITDRAPV